MPKTLYQAQTLDTLPENARRVNTFMNKDERVSLGQDYFIVNEKNEEQKTTHKLFKQMKDGRYREICPQFSVRISKYSAATISNFVFSFDKLANGHKAQLGDKRLDSMSFVKRKEEPFMTNDEVISV
jgi:hypothetical protein